MELFYLAIVIAITGNVAAIAFNTIDADLRDLFTNNLHESTMWISPVRYESNGMPHYEVPNVSNVRKKYS